jgi:NAD(P)-dependent dehydrogenase (short-subunit alcohol dehydrogenase family)
MKRTVLVSGANRGIGLAIARQLAELGNSVLLGSRDLKAGEEAAKSLRRLGLDVAPVHVDLTVSATIDAAINDIAKLAASSTYWSITLECYTKSHCLS